MDSRRQWQSQWGLSFRCHRVAGDRAPGHACAIRARPEPGWGFRRGQILRDSRGTTGARNRRRHSRMRPTRDGHPSGRKQALARDPARGEKTQRRAGFDQGQCLPREWRPGIKSGQITSQSNPKLTSFSPRMHRQWRQLWEFRRSLGATRLALGWD